MDIGSVSVIVRMQHFSASPTKVDCLNYNPFQKFTITTLKSHCLSVKILLLSFDMVDNFNDMI